MLCMYVTEINCVASPRSTSTVRQLRLTNYDFSKWTYPQTTVGCLIAEGKYLSEGCFTYKKKNFNSLIGSRTLTSRPEFPPKRTCDFIFVTKIDILITYWSLGKQQNACLSWELYIVKVWEKQQTKWFGVESLHKNFITIL